MLKRNQLTFGVLNIMDNNANVVDMEKEQLKSALKSLAKQQGISLSDLASQAGIAPSTLTGFMNDVPGRGHYGLSARTQTKLINEYPDFRESIETPSLPEDIVTIPIIGMWGLNYRVDGLELGMTSSFTTEWTTNVHLYSSVIRSPNFFKNNMFAKPIGSSSKKINSQSIEEIRYYLFKNSYVENLSETANKQVYCKTTVGNFIGYQVAYKDVYLLCDFWGNHIEQAGEVKKASKVDWTRQA